MTHVIKLLLVLAILVAIVPQSTSAYSQFAGSTSEIVLEKHLIEMGYDTSGHTTSVVSRETLVFKNYGDNYSGPLMAWIPDESTNIFIFKSSHQAEGKELLNYTHNENIITWEANLMQNVVIMYSIEYMTDLESGFDGSMVLRRIINNKTLLYPTSIFKLALSGDDAVVFENLDGKTIVPDNTESVGIFRVFSWGSEGDVLELNGVNILRMNNKDAGNTEYQMFIISGIIMFIVLLYTFISGKFKDHRKGRANK